MTTMTTTTGTFRLAEHAVDRSYSRLFLALDRCNVSMEASGGDDLQLLITPVTSPRGGHMGVCDGHAVVVTGTEAWSRRSVISTPGPCSHLIVSLV